MGWGRRRGVRFGRVTGCGAGSFNLCTTSGCTCPHAALGWRPPGPAAESARCADGLASRRAAGRCSVVHGVRQVSRKPLYGRR